MLDRHIHLQITAVARWLLIFGAKIPSTLLEGFFWGGGRGWRRSFKHFLECTYFSRLAKVIIRILQPLLCFFPSLGFNLFFFHLLNVYPLTRFLITALLASSYYVTLFSNTPANIRFHKQQLRKHFSRKNFLQSKYSLLSMLSTYWLLSENCKTCKESFMHSLFASNLFTSNLHWDVLVLLNCIHYTSVLSFKRILLGLFQTSCYCRAKLARL